MACGATSYAIDKAASIQTHGVRFLHFARHIGRIAMRRSTISSPFVAIVATIWTMP
jgi:hypothetical protein